MALAQHICIRLSNDAVIAGTPEDRRALARAVLDKGREANLLAFGQADNHLHLLPACERARAGRFAQAVEASLQHRLDLDAPFAPAFIKPVEDARHLYSAFRYVLRQREHHGLDGDPLREASNLPDLLGLRTLGSTTRANVRRWLPRIRRAELLELLGVPDLAPNHDPLERVLEATLAATALPALAGSAPQVLAARRALIEVVDGRLHADALAATIGVSPRTLFRLKACGSDGALVTAVRLQLDLLGRLSAATTPSDAPFAPIRGGADYRGRRTWAQRGESAR